MSVSPPKGHAIADSTSTVDPGKLPGPSSAAPRPILPRLHNVTSPSYVGVVSPRRKDKRLRTNVTIACDGCKLARAKCDGKQPCLRCSRRSRNCKYDHGQDRRQHRGSQEAIQELAARLMRYQRFVDFLRQSPCGDADYFLRRLRSTSAAVVEDHQSPAADVNSTASVQHPTENEQDLLTAADTEDTTALVEWITRDLYLLAAARGSPQKEPSPSDLDECDMSRPRIDPKIDPKLDDPQFDPRINRVDLTVQGLLC